MFPLTGHGVYIHKVTGAIHFRVDIEEGGMDVTATSLGGGGSVSKKSLCFTINHLLSICRKPVRSHPDRM